MISPNTWCCRLGIFLALLSLSTTQKLADSLNSFSIDLLSETTNLAPKDLNIALSPYTVWSLLTVVAEGALGNTAKQLDTTLNVPSDKDKIRNDYLNFSNTLLRKSDGVRLELNKAIFTDQDIGLMKGFEYAARKYYSATLMPTDFKNSFKAVDQINRYIAQATNNRIPIFVNANDVNLAQLFITSIFYFKGTWTLPFPINETHTEPFFDDKNMKIGNVQMMFQKGIFPYSRIPDINSFAVELPYGADKKMSMVIILPFKGENITSVLKSLSKIPFSTVLQTLSRAGKEYKDEDVYVHLPKFKIVSDFNLNEVLYKMGIKDLFVPQLANLKGMLDKPVFLSRLLQRADIEVSEEGTEASAAAGGAFPNKSTPPRLRANRPFLYFIIDNPTRSILFAGRVTNPNTLM